ncbi:hypothetical protein B3286c1_1763 [Brucella vulpis]|nr:hypothetical protein BF3285c1_1764 [Brucella vulpis]CUW50564.1 hypothetical protein B3286c1_1763 [Brucella vulpis]
MSAYFAHDTEGFWLDIVRSLGSNSATDGFASIEGLIASKRLSSRELRRLQYACRSLMDAAASAASEAEARQKRPWEFKDERYEI